MYASDLKHASPSLEEKLRALFALRNNKTIELSFRAPYLRLLEKFGDPHLHLPPVIHVAGTNGKGSIVAMLKSVLLAQGYRVHAYTSPHLVRFNERICLAGRNIADEALETLIDEALALNAGRDVSFFEITTVMAFAAFARAPGDVLLLETGMGGRLDCTNVIQKPLCTVVGSIGLDHMEYLGPTLADIAREKAGIAKPGAPMVLGIQSAEALDAQVPKVFEECTSAVGAKLYQQGSDWAIEPKSDHLRFTQRATEWIVPRPNLNGAYQIKNLGAALSALELSRDVLPVSQKALDNGLRRIEWPGRMQKIKAGAFGLDPSWEVILDGAHNENAAQELAEQAAAWQEQDRRKLHLVLGMMNRKDPVQFVRKLLPYVCTVDCVSIPGEPAAFDGAALKQCIMNTESVPTCTHESFRDALNRIANEHSGGRILITGSLYLAGHVLQDTQDCLSCEAHE